MADTGFISVTANNQFNTAGNAGYLDPQNVHVATTAAFATPNSGSLADHVWHTPTGLETAIPVGATIDGIEVEVAIRDNIPDGGNFLQIALTSNVSKTANGGGTYTARKNTPDVGSGSSFSIFVLGGPTDKWGRTWVRSDFSDANHGILVEGRETDGFLDEQEFAYMREKVYFTAAGGGRRKMWVG